MAGALLIGGVATATLVHPWVGWAGKITGIEPELQIAGNIDRLQIHGYPASVIISATGCQVVDLLAIKSFSARTHRGGRTIPVGQVACSFIGGVPCEVYDVCGCSGLLDFG